MRLKLYSPTPYPFLGQEDLKWQYNSHIYHGHKEHSDRIIDPRSKSREVDQLSTGGAPKNGRVGIWHGLSKKGREQIDKSERDNHVKP